MLDYQEAVAIIAAAARQTDAHTWRIGDAAASIPLAIGRPTERVGVGDTIALQIQGQSETLAVVIVSPLYAPSSEGGMMIAPATDTLARALMGKTEGERVTLGDVAYVIAGVNKAPTLSDLARDANTSTQSLSWRRKVSIFFSKERRAEFDPELVTPSHLDAIRKAAKRLYSGSDPDDLRAFHPQAWEEALAWAMEQARECQRLRLSVRALQRRLQGILYEGYVAVSEITSLPHTLRAFASGAPAYWLTLEGENFNLRTQLADLDAQLLACIGAARSILAPGEQVWVELMEARMEGKARS